MPTLELEIKVVGAQDGADDLKDFSNAAKDAGNDVKTAGSSFGSATSNLSQFKTQLTGVVGSFTALSGGILGIVRSITQLEQGQVRVDQANKRVEDSANKVEKALRKYNDAVREFGPNSEEAKAAADKLKSSQEGYAIAVDRSVIQQQKQNENLASFATDIVPNALSVFGSLIGIISTFTTKGADGVSMAGRLKDSFKQLGDTSVSSAGSLGKIGTAASVVTGVLAGLKIAQDFSNQTGFTTNQIWSNIGKAIGDAIPQLRGALTEFGKWALGVEQWANNLTAALGLGKNYADIAFQVGEASKTAGSSLDIFSQALANLQSNLQFVGNVIFTNVIQPLINFGTQLQQALGQVPGWINTNVVQPILNIPAQLQNLGSQIYQKIIAGWNSLTQWVTTNVIQPIQNIPSQLQALGQFIYNKIIEGWQNLTTWVNTNIVTPIKNAPSQIQALGQEIYNKVISGWQQLTTWVDTNIVQPIKQSPTNIGAVGANIYNKVIEGWKALTEWVTTNIVQPVQKAPEAIGALGEKIRAKIIEGWNSLTEWVKTNITDPIQNFVDDLKAKGGEIWDKLSSGWKDLQDWVTKNIVDPLTGFIDKVKSVGGELWDKLVSGWKSIEDWAQDNIIKPISDIPSKIPPDVGNRIAEAIWKGIAEFDILGRLKKNLFDPINSLFSGTQFAPLKTGLGEVADAEDKVGESAKKAATNFDEQQKSLDKLAQSIGSLNALLATSQGQAMLMSQGILQVDEALAKAQASVVSGRAGLQEYNATLQQFIDAAKDQGIIDFANKLNDAAVAAANVDAQFKAFVQSLGSAKEAAIQFNAGFSQGEKDIQAWAENLQQAQAKIEGTRSALEAVIPKLGIDFPQNVNLSNKAMMEFAEAVTTGSDTITKTLEAADKQWAGILDSFNKAVQQAPKDQQSAWAELQKTTKSAYDELQKSLQSHTGNQQEAWNKYFQKINEAQAKFNTDSKQSWTKYFQEIQDQMSRPLTQIEQQMIASFATMADHLKKNIGSLNTDLQGIKWNVPQAFTQFQTDFSNAINQMRTDMQKLPPAAQDTFGALIDWANKLPTKTQDDYNKKVSALKAIYDVMISPLGMVGDKTQIVQGVMEKIQGTTPEKPVQGLGTAASTATPLINDFATALGTVGSAIQTFMESLPQNISDQLSGLGPAIQNAFTNAFTQAMGGVSTFLQTAMQSLSQNIPSWLTGFGPAITTVFTNAFTNAFTQVQTFLQTSFGSIAQNATSWLAPLAPAVQTAFTNAFTQAFAGVQAFLQQGFGSIAQNAGSWLVALGGSITTAFTNAFSQAFAAVQAFLQQGFGSIAQNAGAWLVALGGSVTTAFTNAFTQAFSSVQSFLQQGFGSIAQNAGAWLAPLGPSVSQAFTNAFTQAFSAVQSFLAQAFGSLAQNVQSWLSGLGSAVQQAFTNAFTQAFSAVQSFLQTSFGSIAQNVTSWLSGLNGAVTSVFQQAFTQAVNQATQTVQQGMQRIQQSVQQAMQAAGQAVQQFTQTLSQIPRQININVTANTAQASQALSSLQQQINQLRASAPPGVLGFARRGGNFEVGVGGFAPLQAQGGGAFIATKRMRFGNLTVGEGNRAELVAFHKDGRLSVDPLPFFNAQTGGVYGPLAGMGFTPGGFQQSGGQPQEYNIPAPVQTVGQGGPQQGMPSEVGAGTILVGPGGQAQPGPVTAPPGGGPAGGFGGLIPGAPSGGATTILPQTGLPTETNVQAPVAPGGIAQTQAVPSTGASDVSPYEMAQMTGQAVASETQPTQEKMQSDMSDLLAAVRKLLSKISSRDINANLVVDGQKMASTVSKYIGSGAYGGR